MTKVDQYESVFRAAARTVYVHQAVEIGSVLVVTDLDPSEAEGFGARLRTFLAALDSGENLRWRVVNGQDFGSVPELLELVESERPGLLCTYRHLHSESWRWPYTLGEYVDVLTQATDTPVLVTPHPRRSESTRGGPGDTSDVMAMTDRVSGDDRLVNFAARFTAPGGRLILAHVEDDAVFERYMDAISKIASLNTDTARHGIIDRLLKDSADYIDSCRSALKQARPHLTVEQEVGTGHRISSYKRLIDRHEVDLLVMNTKAEDQLAMHGLAYPLAVEVRDIPLLML